MRKTILLLSLLLLCCFVRSQQPEFINLKNELKLPKADTTKVKILQKMGKMLMDSEPNEAMRYFEEALELGKKINFKLGRSYTFIGEIHSRQNRFSEALKYFLLALEEAKKMSSKPSLAVCYTNISAIYGAMSNWPLMVKYDIMAINIYEELNDVSGVADNYYNLGVFSSRLNRSDEGIKYLKESLKSYIKLKDSISIALVYEIISVCEQQKKNFTESLRLANMALDIRKKIKDTAEIPLSYLNISAIYHSMDRQNLSLRYNLMALKLYLELKRMQDAGTIYTAISSNYYELGDYDKALSYLKKGDEILGKGQDYERILIIYKNYSLIFGKKGDYKKAFEYQKLFIKLNDSIFNINKNKEFAEMETKFQTEKKEKEIENLSQNTQILTQKTLIQELDIKQKWYYIFGLAVTAMLIIITAFLLGVQNKLKAKQAKIEIEQKLFRSQMNPHFIFNSLIAIQNYVYKHKPDEVAGYISSFAKLMRMILENSRSETIPIEKEIATLNYYLELQQLRFPAKFKFKIEVDEKIDVESILIPPMLSQPFIENAIEHGIMNKGDANNLILIIFRQLKDVIEIRVRDNGIGREHAKKLKPQSAEKHESLATTITQERLNLLNKKGKNKATLEIIDLTDENGVSIGTEVIICVPEL